MAATASVPKAAHAIVATYVRTIFMQPDAESVRAQHARAVEQLRNCFPKAAAMLQDAAEEAARLHGVPEGTLAPDLEQ